MNNKHFSRAFLGLILLCGMVFLSACHNVKYEGKRVQKTFLQQQDEAMRLTERLQDLVLGSSFDSVWNLTQNTDILFYVFDRSGMVYWSDNWLAGTQIRLRQYDQWYYQKFDNAHCVCRWTQAGPYNILSVIPIKYAYPLANKQLRNAFIPPFKGCDECDITIAKNNNYFPIYSADSTYVFSICSSPLEQKAAQQPMRLAPTFSYQPILQTDTEEAVSAFNRGHARMYFRLTFVFFAVLLVIGSIGLVRNHGFRKMTLRTKFSYLIVSLLSLNALVVFLISIGHVKQRYAAQQEQQLRQKTTYIQHALQEIYFWNVNLGPAQSAGMNIDLRDLSFAYQSDIHVYDMSGNLVGSSAIDLFDKGLRSRHIDPHAFFESDPNILRQEDIGDLHYLSSYTAFFNGNYVQIGYINVPLFLSQDALNAEVDAFIAKLLPTALLVILISFLLGLAVTRTLTRPLSELADKMRHFKIGQQGNRLDYDKSDEIGQLVVRYNQMVDELESATERLAKSERETAWRTMARQIAHEINNPLTPMKLTIQQLQRTKKMGDARFDDYFDKSTHLLIEQIDNLSHIAASFSTFAKMPEVVPEKVNIAERLYSVIELFRNNNSQVPIRYVGPQTGVEAMADKEQIGQVFNNLIKNALQAIENKKEGDIIVLLKDLPTQVEISVSDNGCGIPPEIQDKVFRPNFTTKSTGMGLGLAISKNIITGSGGSIRFETSPQGTTFYILLPKPTA